VSVELALIVFNSESGLCSVTHAVGPDDLIRDDSGAFRSAIPAQMNDYPQLLESPK
jgi:hypothetical protein